MGFNPVSNGRVFLCLNFGGVMEAAEKQGRDTGSKGQQGKVSVFERHLQTGLVTVLTALVLWGGDKVFSGMEKQALAQVRTDERLKSIESKLERLDDAGTVVKVRELEIRVIALERRLGSGNARTN